MRISIVSAIINYWCSENQRRWRLRAEDGSRAGKGLAGEAADGGDHAHHNRRRDAACVRGDQRNRTRLRASRVATRLPEKPRGRHEDAAAASRTTRRGQGSQLPFHRSRVLSWTNTFKLVHMRKVSHFRSRQATSSERRNSIIRLLSFNTLPRYHCVELKIIVWSTR